MQFRANVPSSPQMHLLQALLVIHTLLLALQYLTFALIVLVLIALTVLVLQ